MRERLGTLNITAETVCDADPCAARDSHFRARLWLGSGSKSYRERFAFVCCVSSFMLVRAQIYATIGNRSSDVVNAALLGGV